MTEVRPIDLCLLAGKGLQAQERLADLGAQAGHRAPQLDDAAGVTAIADHLVNAGGAQPRMLVQGLADELGVGIDNGRTQRLACCGNVPTSMALRTVSGCTPSSLAMVPIFQCSA